MSWIIERTDTFLKALKPHKKDAELIHALQTKIIKLQDDPHSVGGFLHGKLHGFQSTRLIRKYRLLFKIDEEGKKVFLVALDHRKEVYE